MSRIEPTDPRLTAYALDEMPAAERAAFAAELRTDPAARAFVDEIRQTATALTNALEQEPAPERIIEPPRPRRQRTRNSWSAIPWTLWAPLAATVCFALLYALHRPADSSPGESVTVVTHNLPTPVAAPTADAPKVPLVARAKTEPEATTDRPAPPMPVDKIPPASLPTADNGTVPAYATHSAAEAADFSAPSDNVTVAPKPSLRPDPDLVVLSPFVLNGEREAHGRAPAAPATSRARNERNDLSASAAGTSSDRSAEGARARAAYENSGNSRPPGPFSPRSNPDAPAQPAARPPARLLDVDLPPVADGWRHSVPRPSAGHGGDAAIAPSDFLVTAEHPLSTVALDSDTAAYAGVRRFLTSGQRPPAGLVRIEELVNAFPYTYPPPTDAVPIAIFPELHPAPWAPEHLLLRIGLQGRALAEPGRPATNLVFLVDVSGSMAAPGKLPLVREALRLLAARLRPQDRIAIAVYAGAGGLVLPSTSGSHRTEILAAVEQLTASGSTTTGPGIQLAYDLAQAGFIPGGANRVLLCTDGDFNLGLPNRDDLLGLIAAKAQAGIGLATLGFGLDGGRDSAAEKLAATGGGRCGYVDSLREARQLLVEQRGAPCPTIATDVNMQVEFNPAKVAAYRMIGYETRAQRPDASAAADSDADGFGAGQAVTALYELVPVGVKADLPAAEPLRYQQPAATAAAGDEWLTVKVRYKDPGATTSQTLAVPLREAQRTVVATTDFKFASAVAGFGLLLQDHPHKGAVTWTMVETLAREGLAGDPSGDRAEFLDLVRKARELGGSK